MADTTVNFAASVDDWTKQATARLEAVFRMSVQDVVAEMQRVGPSVASTRAAIAAGKGVGPAAPGGEGGRMPVDTGFLRASLRVTVGAPAPLATGGDRDGPVAYNPEAYALTIASLQIGDVVFAAYTAVYARRVNYGFTGTDNLGRSFSQRGYHFVDLAAQKWQQIVTANVAKLRDAAEGKTDG